MKKFGGILIFDVRESTQGLWILNMRSKTILRKYYRLEVFDALRLNTIALKLNRCNITALERTASVFSFSCIVDIAIPRAYWIYHALGDSQTESIPTTHFWANLQ